MTNWDSTPPRTCEHWSRACNTAVTASSDAYSMRTRSSDRTGILIIRVWMEQSAHEGLRARITHTLDSTDPDQATATAASPEDIYAAVRTWVERFVEPMPMARSEP